MQQPNTISSPHKLPVANLLALTVCGFVAILTETVPAGLLPLISRGLRISNGMAGQFISVYALGSVLAAIPIISLTQSWNRKKLLLTAVSGFFITNIATCLLDDFYILLSARFVAGMAAGVIWGMLTGYTASMVPENLFGKAMAVVGVGQPIALSIGVPLGTILGNTGGWQAVFAIIAAVTFFLFIWIKMRLPDFGGKTKVEKQALKNVFQIREANLLLSAAFFWIIAHNVLYTYISPWLASVNFPKVDVVLMIFGFSSIAGIWLTGLLLDKCREKLGVAGLAVFIISIALLLIAKESQFFLYLGIVLWGTSFGGAPIILQKLLANTAGSLVDLAQAVFVTIFNLAVAGGGIAGALVITGFSLKFLLIFAILFVLSAAIAFLAFIKSSKKADFDTAK